MWTMLKLFRLPPWIKFISELLLPCPPTSIPYTEVRNSNNAFDAGDQTNSSSASSPQDQREGRIPDVSPESLASFQRSGSRQRALELRNSAEAYRSQLLVDNNTGLFPTENIEPEIAPLMLDHVDELELGNNGSCEVEEEANVGDLLSKGKESRKEELISGRLLPSSQLCSGRDHVPYNKLAFISENEELFVGNDMEVTTDGQYGFLQFPGAGCDSNGVPELESGATYPQEWNSFRHSMELICADISIPELEMFIFKIDIGQSLRILNNYMNPGSSEEVVDVVQEDHVKEMVVTSLREPLADVTENPNLPASASEAEIFAARNPLVSNVSSFVPLVKQKQAAAIATGKTHKPVKALRLAQLAKRLAEEKENKRNMEKVARKAERARRMELLKKEDERKKKEADLAERRKRQMERGKKDKEPKRKPVKINLVIAYHEESYAISPYKENDDDDDGIPFGRHIPSWASENCLALAVSSQQSQNLEEMFTPESFCSISEVLLPRRLQQK